MMVGGAPSTNLVQFASPLADDQSVPECLADPTPYPAEFVYGTAGAFLQVRLRENSRWPSFAYVTVFLL